MKLKYTLFFKECSQLTNFVHWTYMEGINMAHIKRPAPPPLKIKCCLPEYLGCRARKKHAVINMATGKRRCKISLNMTWVQSKVLKLSIGFYRYSRNIFTLILQHELHMQVCRAGNCIYKSMTEVHCVFDEKLEKSISLLLW